MSESTWSSFLRRILGKRKGREVVLASTFPIPIDNLTVIDRSGRPFRDGLVEVQGVVSPSSPGAGGGSGGYNVQIFLLSAWRRIGQPLVEKKSALSRQRLRGCIFRGKPTTCSEGRRPLIPEQGEHQFQAEADQLADACRNGWSESSEYAPWARFSI